MKFSFIAIISILFILARAFGPQTPSATETVTIPPIQTPSSPPAQPIPTETIPTEPSADPIRFRDDFNSKLGGTYIFHSSPDGNEWALQGGQTSAGRLVQIGLIAGRSRAGTNAGPFDYFEVGNLE